MDVGVCTPGNPLFCKHLVHPHSLGCTGPMCYIMTESLHMKQAKQREERVKFADLSGKIGLLWRTGSPCGTTTN